MTEKELLEKIQETKEEFARKLQEQQNQFDKLSKAYSILEKGFKEINNKYSEALKKLKSENEDLKKVVAEKDALIADLKSKLNN